MALETALKITRVETGQAEALRLTLPAEDTGDYGYDVVVPFFPSEFPDMLHAIAKSFFERGYELARDGDDERWNNGYDVGWGEGRDELQDEHDREIEGRDLRIDELEDDLRYQENRADELERQVEDLQYDIDNLKADVSDHVRTIEAHEVTIYDLRAELRNAREQLARI